MRSSISNSDFASYAALLIDRIRRLPAHDEGTVTIAAKQLELLDAAIPVPFLDRRVAEITRDECVRELEALRDMSFDELSGKPGIEERWEKIYGPRPTSDQRMVWSEYVKRSRMEQLVRAFELTSRLRDDEPEAWDEINELYFDD